MGKTNDRRAKRSEAAQMEIATTGSSSTYMGYLRPCSIQVQFGALAKKNSENTISKKAYFFYKSQPRFIKLLLNDFPSGPHKTTFGIFEILSFRFLTFFFQIHHCTLWRNQTTSNIWKTSDRNAKRSEIWDSGSSSIYMGYLFVAFKVIFGVIRYTFIFLRNLGPMIRDKRTDFKRLRAKQ